MKVTWFNVLIVAGGAIAWISLLYWMWQQMRINKHIHERLCKLEDKR